MIQPIIFTVKGMHCNSCELLIKDELSEIKGVTNPVADYKRGIVQADVDTNIVKREMLQEAIKNAGYEIEHMDEIKQDIKTNGNGIVKQHIFMNDQTENVKLVIHSTTTLDGKVVGQDSDAVFEGKITTDRTAEMMLPKKQQLSEEYLSSLIHSLDTTKFLETVKKDTKKFEVKQITQGVSTLPKTESREQKNTKQKTTLSLSGMHCTSCANLITRSLKKVPGVTDANVNFASEKATVLY